MSETVDRAIARMLAGTPAWSTEVPEAEFLERCRFHGVSALLHHLAGERREFQDWPLRVIESLRATSLEQAGLELARRRELMRLLPEFVQAGAQPIQLKGTALAYTLYPQPHLRPVVDADLLVHPRQRFRLFQVLRNAGYASTAFQGGSVVNAQASYWRTLPSGVTITFDVHWRISTSPLFATVLSYDEVRSRTVAIAPLGPHALGLPVPDALLHACVHRAPMTAVYSNRLIWLYDIHLLASRLDEPGWADFLNLARRHRLRGICRQALDASAQWLGTRIPEQVQTALSESHAEPAAALLAGSAWRLKLAEIGCLPTWREKVQYIRETALPAPAYMYDLYQVRHRWLLPALYLRRALGWLIR